MPMTIFRILAWLHMCPDLSDAMDLDFIEWFSGVGELVRAFKGKGLKSCGFELEAHANYENMMTNAGFLNALQRARRLKAKTGFQTFACVCSSWIFLSRGSTGPMGGLTRLALSVCHYPI